MERPTVDVIVPHYGGTDLTWRCLLHLWAFGDPGQRIVVVDDASPDQMPVIGEWLNRSGRAIYHRHATNRGCTNAWNTGIELTRERAAPYTAFVNNDLAVMPQTFGALLEAARSGHRVVGVQDHIGAKLEPELLLPAAGDGERPLELSTGMGSSCFIVERSLLESMGGFDGRMEQGFGDTDFYMRARVEHGVVPKVVKQARTFHGASVAAKRVGLEKSCARFIADQDVFRSKWGDNPLENWAPSWLTLEKLKPVVTETWRDGEH